jgi:dolichol-phosphate mannosyltransferase
VNTPGPAPLSGTARPTLLVVSDDPAHEAWLNLGDWGSVGVGLAWIREANGLVSHSSGKQSYPDLQAISARLEAIKPDGCLLLSDSPLSRLVWVLADLANVPVLVIITTQEQLQNLTRRRKPKPDLFFVANPDLLPAALEDDRYGSTLLATGHPGLDLGPSGPSAATARMRLLTVVHQWWQGEISSSAPELSVIVPAYREAGNLPLVCDRLVNTIEQEGLDAEILLVDDGSPDETYRVALAQMWRSPRIRAFTKDPPRGMGNSIRHGLSRARGSILAITMGDGSDDVGRIPEMVRKVRDEQYGLAIGSRYRRRENYQAVPRLYRFWSAIFRYTAWTLIGVRLRDYTNAFRVFRRSILDRQGLEGGGFEISPEITFKAWFATRRVAEVDVKHLKRGTGQSNFSFMRAGPGYGKMVIKAMICRATGRWFVLDW